MLASYSGLPHPDFIAQLWRNIREYASIFLHGCVLSIFLYDYEIHYEIQSGVAPRCNLGRGRPGYRGWYM